MYGINQNLKYVQNLANKSQTVEKWLTTLSTYTTDSQGLFITTSKTDSPLPEGTKQDFLPDEIIIATVLATAIKEASADHLPKILEALEKGDVSAYQESYNDLKDSMQNGVLSEEQEEAIDKQLEDVITKGALVSVGTINLLIKSRKNAIKEGLKNQTIWFTNNYAGRIVQPKINEAISKLNSGAVADVPAAFTKLKDSVEKDFTDSPYFKTVANTQTSRAYHYGVLKSGEALGYSKYRYRAILDSRTTRICRELDGIEYSVPEAVSGLETVTQANPEAAISSYPFIDEKTLPENNVKEYLKSLGAKVPPQHFNCRSSLVFVR